ncbi:hypothetical protein BDQ17DRAFT_1106932 [Cyathus striatus]|nr:hypothetical protein BDQ17DRAFT_1106932 [Cyathus striatus]
MGPIRLERFILLSGQVPLHIWFPQVSGLLGDRCTEVVINSVHRWETITIANGALLETISTRIPGDVTFSCLKYLSLSNITHSMSLYPSPRMTHLNLADIETQGITISLQSAPSLTHLCVSGLEQISDMLIDFPWIQITHFECSFGFFGEELSGIIQSMPNLTLFKLRGSSMISECISFPRLRMLMLVGGLRGYYTNVLDTKFTAPQLKVLHLNDNKYCHLSDIFQFLQRSDCQFEELTMNNIYTPRSDEDWKVEQLQKVKKLHLKQPDFGTTSFIQNLCYVLPELETLVISDLQLYDASKEITLVDDLTILLRSRLGSPVLQSSSERKCSLKSVTVEFEFDRRTLDMDIENTMRDFIRSDLVRQAGIALTISYGTHDNPSKYIVLNGVEQHDTETISGI